MSRNNRPMGLTDRQVLMEFSRAALLMVRIGMGNLQAGITLMTDAQMLLETLKDQLREEHAKRKPQPH